MDDYIDIFDTSEDAIEVAKKVRTIPAMAGFEIRHWLSNLIDVKLEIGRTKDATDSTSKAFTAEVECGLERG